MMAGVSGRSLCNLGLKLRDSQKAGSAGAISQQSMSKCVSDSSLAYVLV